MSASSQNNSSALVLPEQEILQAIRGIRFGVVEVVVHDSRVTEIRQTRRVRLASPINFHPTRPREAKKRESLRRPLHGSFWHFY